MSEFGGVEDLYFLFTTEKAKTILPEFKFTISLRNHKRIKVKCREINKPNRNYLKSNYIVSRDMDTKDAPYCKVRLGREDIIFKYYTRTDITEHIQKLFTYHGKNILYNG